MTTNVTVTTHDWPCAVVTTNTNTLTGEVTQSEKIVPPKSSATDCIYPGRKLEYIELPKPVD